VHKDENINTFSSGQISTKCSFNFDLEKYYNISYLSYVKNSMKSKKFFLKLQITV